MYYIDKQFLNKMLHRQGITHVLLFKSTFCGTESLSKDLTI